jgi:hypothetical protein
MVELAAAVVISHPPDKLLGDARDHLSAFGVEETVNGQPRSQGSSQVTFALDDQDGPTVTSRFQGRHPAGSSTSRNNDVVVGPQFSTHAEPLFFVLTAVSPSE